MSGFMDGIRVIFFDVDNTLLDFRKCAQLAMQNAAAQQGICLPESAEESFHRINDSLWLGIQDGSLTMKELHAVRWVTILEELGVEGDGAEMEKAFVKELHESAELMDGAMELVRGLSRKYTLCIASNAALEEQTHRLEKAGLLPYFSKIFTSAEIGCAKPQKAFFDACFEQLPGVRPEETIMIGDSISSDMEGAHDYGMRTYWLNLENREDIPDCVDKSVTSWR